MVRQVIRAETCEVITEMLIKAVEAGEAHYILEAELEKPDTKNIKAKVVFVSDLNESNIWSILGNYAVISNVKITSSFVNIKLPNNFLRVYKKLPERFKLSDFEREILKISKKKFVILYH